MSGDELKLISAVTSPGMVVVGPVTIFGGRMVIEEGADSDMAAEAFIDALASAGWLRADPSVPPRDAPWLSTALEVAAGSISWDGVDIRGLLSDMLAEREGLEYQLARANRRRRDQAAEIIRLRQMSRDVPAVTYDGFGAAIEPEIIHACPPKGATVTPCCGKTPFELPRDHRMSADTAPVTCRQRGEWIG